MKNKTGTLLIFIGTVLIASALSLTFYNIYTDKNAKSQSSNILLSLEAEIPQLEKPSESEIQSLDEKTEMDYKEIDNNKYVGIIHIPSLNIKLPVMSQCSYDNLKLSPCQYSGNIDNDSMIIAGHNYSSHFGKLKQLNNGDEVYFIDVNGNVYSYTVTGTETLDSTAADEMESGQWDMTLFTCNFSGSKRITVRCEKIQNK